MLFSSIVDNYKKKKPGLFENFDSSQLQNISTPKKLDPIQETNTKPSLFAGLADAADNQPAPSQSLNAMNDYGVERPEIKNTKWWEHLINIALPGVAAMGSGEGLIPGLAMGYFNDRAQSAARDASAMERFDKDRQFRQKDEEIKANRDLAQAQLGALTDYRNKSLGLEGQKIDSAAGKAGRDAADDIRKEYFSNPIVKDTQNSTIAIKKIRGAAAKDINDSGFDDQALIFNFMKVLDPGSTVREGEFNEVAKNADMFERLGIPVQKLIAGKRLLPEQRAKLLEAAERQYKGTLDTHDAYKNQLNQFVERRGIDPKDVFIDFGQGQSKSNSPPTGAKTIMKFSDGNEYYVDENKKRIGGPIGK